ncbi:MAG: VCBS repeat-containing protein [Deltaproteobacteria bacterium]|nr:VCBS repeat-containing protein [Deltaproteobacteria bacterium]
MKSISFILGLAVTGCLVLPAPARADAPERVDSREVGKIADDEDAKRVCPRVCAPPARWNGKWRPKRGGAFVCDCVVSGQPEAAAPEHHDGPPARRRRGAVANDVDGDGKADLVLQYDHKGKRRWQARRSTGEAFGYNKDWTDTSTPDVVAFDLFDADGDGRADLVLQYDHEGKRRWQVRRSTGTAFAHNGDWSDTTTPAVKPVGAAWRQVANGRR